MDSNIYMHYNSQIKELERQVGAKVKGAKERRGAEKACIKRCDYFDLDDKHRCYNVPR